MSGTRPGQNLVHVQYIVGEIKHYITLHTTGGNIASSWAVLQCMGEDGYLKIAERLMAVTTRLKDGISSIEVLFSLN